MKSGLLAGACLLVSATCASAESPTFYKACDGYGSPTSSGDGMTKEATGLGGLIGVLGASGNTRRSTPELGAAGIAACDRALTDGRLVDKHWLRRASLLRARAIHDLAASKPDQAIADLDRALAATRSPDDPFIKRSMVLGIEVVRGYALAQKGDLAAGRSIVAAAQRQRSYDRALGLAIMGMLVDNDVDPAGLESIHAVARLDPRIIDLLFQIAFEKGDFRGAIDIFPHIRPMTRTGDIGVSRAESNVQDFKKELEEIRFGINRAGQLAYAHAALGQPAEARAAIERGRAALASQVPAPLPPLAPGEKEGSRHALDRTINGLLVKAGAAGSEQLTAWSTLALLRLELASLGPAEARGRTETARIPRDGGTGASYDLMKLLRAKDPADQKVAAVLADYEVKRGAPATISASDAQLVFSAIPHTEIAQRITTFRKANSDFVGYLWGGVSGFKAVPDKADPARATISFVGERSSSSVVQEMALLRAADYAREHGRTGFVINGRRDYERTTTTTYYGTPLRSDPDGYSTTLEIELVDLAALPAKFSTAPWRAISAADVLTQLGPVYIAPPAARTN